MIRFALLALGVLFTFSLSAQDKPAYRIFHSNGKEASYEDLLKKAQKADAFFFGEQHNNPICHWLQLEITQDLFAAKNGAVLLGAEMFERDNQLLLEEYLSGK
nr:ChaN family lipoprotein [Haliscomenobacter sp.]